MVRRISLILLFLILAQGILFAAAPPGAKSAGLAKDFSLLDLEGKKVFFSEFQGKPVILFFWTTWCPYCRRELKLLNDLRSELSEKGVEVLAINAGESAYQVQRFMANITFPYRVLLDEGTGVARDYGILGVPTYIYIDRAGRIISSGYNFSQEDYQEIISR